MTEVRIVSVDLSFENALNIVAKLFMAGVVLGLMAGAVAGLLWIIFGGWA